MLRSILGSVFVSALVLVACADAASTEGSPGTASLTSLSPEAAGTNCKTGGTKITTGLDLDANGTLDPGEVTSTQYVCNGASGNAGANGENGSNGTGGGSGSLVNIESEPKGANCANGGLRVQTGSDKDGNGKLDAAEVTATQYACNGTNGTNGTNGSGGGVVSAYTYNGTTSSNVNSQANSTTVQQLKVTATGPGKVVALLNADVFCASPATSQGYDCNSNGVTAAYYTLTTNATADAATGNYEYFFLTPNSTENSSRNELFNVAAAGDVTVYVRAKMGGPGQFAFFRSSLTLLFIPN